MKRLDLPVDGGDLDQAQQLTQTLVSTFDVRDAICYFVSDRQRLIAVIEAAYGDTEEFNVSVRRIFSACLKRDAELFERLRAIRGPTRGTSRYLPVERPSPVL